MIKEDSKRGPKSPNTGKARRQEQVQNAAFGEQECVTGQEPPRVACGFHHGLWWWMHGRAA